jgi:hypothetical protein
MSKFFVFWSDCKNFLYTSLSFFLSSFSSQLVNNRYLNRRGMWDHNYGGGVIFTDDDTRANFNNCTFFHNRAYFGGGGVLSQVSTFFFFAHSTYNFSSKIIALLIKKKNGCQQTSHEFLCPLLLNKNCCIWKIKT